MRKKVKFSHTFVRRIRRKYRAGSSDQCTWGRRVLGATCSCVYVKFLGQTCPSTPVSVPSVLSFSIPALSHLPCECLCFHTQGLLSTVSIRMRVGPFTGTWVASWGLHLWRNRPSSSQHPSVASSSSARGRGSSPPPPACAWILAVFVWQVSVQSQRTCAVVLLCSLQTSATSGSYSLSMSSSSWPPGLG